MIIVTLQGKLVDFYFLTEFRLSQIHFRRAHFLCEDEACLAKKFVVFASESEMKVTS